MTDDGDTIRSILDTIEYPHNDEECKQSVHRAYEYIQQSDGATKEEILDHVRPLENYFPPLHVAQAKKIGDHRELREQWWREVLYPSLRQLPAIEQPDNHGGTQNPDESDTTDKPDETWRVKENSTTEDPKPTDSTEFDSPTEVLDITKAGHVFELAYRQDDDVRRIIVTFDRKIRPAALPVGSPPTFRFTAPITEDTIDVPLEKLVDLQPVSLDRLAGPLLTEAVSEVVSSARSEPEKLSLADCQAVLDLATTGEIDPDEGLTLALLALQDRDAEVEPIVQDVLQLLETGDSDLGRRVLDELQAHVPSNPSVVADHVSALSSLASSASYGTAAARCIVSLTESDTSLVYEEIPALAAAAEQGDRATRTQLVYAFSQLAKDYPEELLPAVAVLVESIRSENDNCRTNALAALGRIAGSYPHTASAIVDELVSLLEDDEPPVRANATGLLADIAQAYPEEVVEYAGLLAASLTDEDGDVRQNASIALIQAGGANPAAVRDEHVHLEAALADAQPEVRANACTVIGNADAPVRTERLQSLAEEDPDERVREQARWALHRIG